MWSWAILSIASVVTPALPCGVRRSSPALASRPATRMAAISASFLIVIVILELSHRGPRIAGFHRGCPVAARPDATRLPGPRRAPLRDDRAQAPRPLRRRQRVAGTPRRIVAGPIARRGRPRRGGVGAPCPLGLERRRPDADGERPARSAAPLWRPGPPGGRQRNDRRRPALGHDL